MKSVKASVSIIMVVLVIAIAFCGCAPQADAPSGSQAPQSEASAPAANEPSASAEAGKDKITVGAVMITLTNTFMSNMVAGGNQAGEDYGVEVIWQSADANLEKQISIIENFILQGVDIIFVDPVDAKGILPAIDACKKANVPIVTIANKVFGDGNYNTLYPDFENFQVVARVLGTLMDKQGKCAYLSGSPGNWCGDERDRGFNETMKAEFPDIEIIGSVPTYFDVAQCQKAVETWLSNYPDIEGIGYVSDYLGLVGINIAKTQNRDLIWVGCDGDEEMHPYIDDGTCKIDVLTGAHRVGYWNVAICARIAKGEKMPIDMFMKTYFIMSKETNDLLKSKGLEIPFVTTEEALKVAMEYSSEMGPHKSNEELAGAAIS